MVGMRQLELYMWVGQRRLVLERHDFYVEQVKARVLAQFQDVAGEAERHSEAEYERLGSLPGDEGSDMVEIAEIASDKGQVFYSLLSDLKKQMLLGALAGLYHQWDKDLRDFVERELRQHLKPTDAGKIAWDPNVGNVFDMLAEFGWDCRCAAFFRRIDACRLVVNGYKHGKGRSLDDLGTRYPEYLDDGFTKGTSWLLAPGYLDHEWLSISEPQFDEIADALRQFWVEFPERLYLDRPP
jgi:hypothetical protein